MQIVKDFERKVIKDFGTVEVVFSPSRGRYFIDTKERGLSYMFHHLDNAFETARKIEEEAAKGIYKTEDKLRPWDYNDDPYHVPVYTITLDLVGYGTYNGIRESGELTNFFNTGRAATIGIDRRLEIRTGELTEELYIDHKGNTGDVFATVEDARTQVEKLTEDPSDAEIFYTLIEEYEQRLNEFERRKTAAWEGFGVFKIWEVCESGGRLGSPVWVGEPFNRSTN